MLCSVVAILKLKYTEPRNLLKLFSAQSSKKIQEFFIFRAFPNPRTFFILDLASADCVFQIQHGRHKPNSF